MEGSHSDDSRPLSRAERTQIFLDGLDPIPVYEIADFEKLVGSDFLLTDIEGDSCGKITLSKLDRLPPNETQRKSVRENPFSLIFSRSDDVRLEDGCYKLSLTTDVDQLCILFLKLLDFSEEDELNIYESVIN